MKPSLLKQAQDSEHILVTYVKDLESSRKQKDYIDVKHVIGIVVSNAMNLKRKNILTR